MSVIEFRRPERTWCLCCREENTGNDGVCQHCSMPVPKNYGGIWVCNECGGCALMWLHPGGLHCWRCQSPIKPIEVPE